MSHVRIAHVQDRLEHGAPANLPLYEVRRLVDGVGELYRLSLNTDDNRTFGILTVRKVTSWNPSCRLAERGKEKHTRSGSFAAISSIRTGIKRLPYGTSPGAAITVFQKDIEMEAK